MAVGGGGGGGSSSSSSNSCVASWGREGRNELPFIKFLLFTVGRITTRVLRNALSTMQWRRARCKLHEEMGNYQRGPIRGQSHRCILAESPRNG